MNPKLRAYLESIGLKTTASEAEAMRFWQSLTGDHRTQADSLAAPAASTPPADPPAPAASTTPPAPPVNLDAERRAAAEAERARVSQILGLCGRFSIAADQAQEMIGAGLTIEQARERVLQHIEQSRQPLQPSISVGSDNNLTTLRVAIADGIALRANPSARLVDVDEDGLPRLDSNGRTVGRQPHGRAREFRGRSLIEIGRRYLAVIGAPGTDNMTPAQISGYLINPRKLANDFGIMAALGVGDFANILADTIGKTLRLAYLDAPATWTRWARRATAPDFKNITRTALSEVPDLQPLQRGGEVKHVVLSDTKEVYALSDYANIIPLSRQAIINDDLDAFSRIPTLQGAAARRKEDDVAYDPITSNQTMTEDATALFHSNHGNLAGSGAALSVASLGAARAAMRKAKGPKAKARLNLLAAHLLVPAALETVAEQLIASLVDPAKNNAVPNPEFIRSLNLVVEPRLDDSSATAWYLAAPTNQIDTLEVCFLDGEPMPTLTQETDFDTESVKFKVRHTVAARAIDYRGFYKNPGA